MEIIWSPQATQDFLSILKNVEEAFGKSVAKNVFTKIQSHIGLLAFFPRIGVRDNRFTTLEKDVRYLVNTPNIIYYVIQSDTIFIISILDSRQSPETICRLLTEDLK